MASPPPNADPILPGQSLLRSLSINCRITLYLLDNIDPSAWRVSPPGANGRNIAAVFAHIHSVRLMWLKANGHTPLPAAKPTRKQISPLQRLYDNAAVLDAQERLNVLTGAQIASGDYIEDGSRRKFRLQAIDRLHHRGKLTYEQYAAGVWYREINGKWGAMIAHAPATPASRAAITWRCCLCRPASSGRVTITVRQGANCRFNVGLMVGVHPSAVCLAATSVH